MQELKVMDLSKDYEWDTDIDYDGEYITLKGYYHIALSRISTKEELLSWVRHLLGKNWTTANHIRDIIDIASSHHGFNPYTTV